MDRPEKRANVGGDSPSFLPPAPVPTWEVFTRTPEWPADEPFTMARGQLDPDAVARWVDEVERLLANGSVTREEVDAYEREWLAKYHMDTTRPPDRPHPLHEDFRRRWIGRAFVRTAEAPEFGHNAPNWLARQRAAILDPRALDAPWRMKEFQLREFRVPEYVPLEDEYLARERKNANNEVRRQYNPEQRNMHIYYPRGPNLFAARTGLLVDSPAAHITNEAIDVSSAVRAIDGRHDGLI